MKIVSKSTKLCVRFVGEYLHMSKAVTIVEVTSMEVQDLDIPDDAVSFQFVEIQTFQADDGTKFEAEKPLSPEYKLWEPPRGSYKP